MRMAQAYKDNLVLDYAGVPASQLNKQQKALLLELIAEYVGNMKEGHARVRMEEVRGIWTARISRGSEAPTPRRRAAWLKLLACTTFTKTEIVSRSMTSLWSEKEFVSAARRSSVSGARDRRSAAIPPSSRRRPG